MRRRLSYLTSRRRGRTPVAMPAAPAAFSASLSSARSMGLGRCRSSAPARFLMEANDDNRSWCANRD